MVVPPHIHAKSTIDARATSVGCGRDSRKGKFHNSQKADERELKRARLSGPSADRWDFLQPWCEQLRGRLVLFPGGYINVLWPGARRYRRGEFQTEDDALASKQYDWDAREALELLVLVHYVDHRAWKEVLVEKFQLRFGKEGDSSYVKDDDEGDLVDQSESESVFTFECEHDRDLPVKPQFAFNVRVGSQNPREPSPITRWRKFFMAHESDYSPSPQFLEARDHILRMIRETHGEMTKRQVVVEIPVTFQLTSEMSGNDHFAAHMKQLQELIESMKRYSAEVAGVTSEGMDCGVQCPVTITYTLQRLSLSLIGLDMTETSLESVLEVLGTGVAVGLLGLSLYGGRVGCHMSRQAFARFLIGVFVGPLDSMLPPVPSIGTFVIVCDDDTPWYCEALCSSLASARTPISILEIRDGFENRNRVDLQAVRKRQLALLAEALFYSRSFSGACPTSIRGLSLRDADLSVVNLGEMVNVVDEKDSQFRSIQNSGKRLLLREGTTLRCVEGSDGEVMTQSALLLPFQFKANRKLLDANARKSKVVDVVVPGYGRCFVLGEAVVISPAKGGQAKGEPLSFLSFYHKASVEALDVLLDRVGWSLRSLSLQYVCKLDEDKLMTSIVRTCPLLTNLHIHPRHMNLKRLVTAYERVGKSSSTGITSLVVGSIGPDHGVAFAELLC